MLKRKKNSAIPAKSRPKSTGIQASTRLDSRVSPDAADTSRMKRVRFTEQDIVHEISCKKDASPRPGERNCVPSADSPKPSEYKYYKKLLGDTSLTFCSYPSNKLDKHLKKSQESNCAEKINNIVRNKFQVSRSLSSLEKAISPIDQNTLISAANASTNLDTHELQFMHGETFSVKRLKLLVSAAEILSLEVTELSLKRSDLLLEFLQRLGIKSNESNLNRSQSGCVLFDGRTTSLDTERKSTISFDLNTEFSFNRFGHSTLDHMPSKLDFMASKSFLSPWHSLELSHVPGSVSSLRELARTYDDQHECALQREWCPKQLLGWKNDTNIESEHGSAAVVHGMEMTLKPDTIQPTSMGDDYQWSFSRRNDTTTTHSLSMFPFLLSPNFTSQELISDVFPKSKGYIHEEGNYPVKELSHPVISSQAQNCLALTEDHGLSNSFRWSRILSPSPHSFHIAETFQENIYPRLDELLENRMDLQYGWRSLLSTDFSGRCLSLSHSGLQLCEWEKGKSISPYSNFGHDSRCQDKLIDEEILTHLSDETFDACSIMPFKLPQSVERPPLMLLDRSSWYGSERELSSD